MRKLNKILALILSLTLVLSFLPIFPAMAEESEEFGYAKKLNAEIGETIIDHDYSTMTELPQDVNASEVSFKPTAAVNNEYTLAFDRWWNSASVAYYNVDSANYAAKITMVVDNVQTQRIGGFFEFETIGKDASGNDVVASDIVIGLPDRDVGVPYGGSVNVYNQNAQYGFNTITGVTPFTADSEIETFTLYVYCFNGVNYYTKEDGSLIATSAHNTAATVGENNVIRLHGDYGIVYVTDFVVKELNKIVPENPIENPALEEESGFTVGNAIANFDFSEIEAGTIPNGWTFNSANINKGSSDTAGTNVLRLANDTGTSKASFNLDTSNFVAVVTAGFDYNKALAGSLVLGVSDKNGNFGASWSLGLPKRNEEHMLKAGKSCFTNKNDYYYPAAGNYEYSVNGYTTVTMILYCYNGVISGYWPDGSYVYSIALNANADVSNGCAFYLGNDWATAYIHSVDLYEISPYVPPFESGLVENSGFISNDVYANVDFSQIASGTTPDGWTFNSASIGAGSGESAGKNVLRLSNEWGGTNASLALPFSNFAATVTVGIDYAQKLSGSFVLGALDADGNFAASWSVGLPKRSESQTLKAGKSVITNQKDYRYIAEGNYEYNVDGYTTLKMVMYCYEGNFYFFWEDGRYVGEITASSKSDLSKGAKLYLANDYGRMYVHDLKVYEIIPNSLGVSSAALDIKDNAPVVNFNMSYDNSNANIIAGEDLQFGAIVTVNDNAVATETTVDTEDAVIWELKPENTADAVYKFAKEMAVTADIMDKYINVRTFVKNGEMYSYGDAVSYCPAQLADIFYRSTLENSEKEIVEQFFKDSAVYMGKESRKTTFTVFSDFHYMQGLYISSIADMNEIFDRAYESGSSFVLSAGDMTNDMKGSPELVNALLNNKYGLTAANVYGNHELESGNSMSDVTKTLTNAQNVVWGTADGSFDSSIGHYYFEKDGFRIICTNTNYSWDPVNEIWEHSLPGSWGPPSGNSAANSLGPDQIAWLEDVLYDAAEKDIPCIVMSHAAFKSDWTEKSSDAATVEKLFNDVNKVNPGTVMMHISGHAHDDRIEKANGIVYFRCNTTRNGFWSATNPVHYYENDTFMMETYDAEGNFLGYEEKKIGELGGGVTTYFTKEALSATVTIDECGIITIEGMGATWINGIEPDLTGVSPYIRPQVSNYSSFNCEGGHIWAEKYTVEDGVHYKKCINPECTITEVSENAYYGEHEYVNGVCVCGKTEAAAYEKGDIDGNGSVNAADLALLKKVVAGLTPVDDEEVKNPNADDIPGTPNAADLAALKKKIAGLE